MVSGMVTVSWFDELKGIGEGTLSNGEIVFLNSKFIQEDSTFLTLKTGEIVFCEVESSSGDVFATKIVRNVEQPAQPERSTFLDPKPLDAGV